MPAVKLAWPPRLADAAAAAAAAAEGGSAEAAEGSQKLKCVRGGGSRPRFGCSEAASGALPCGSMPWRSGCG